MVVLVVYPSRYASTMLDMKSSASVHSTVPLARPDGDHPSGSCRGRPRDGDHRGDSRDLRHCRL